MLTPNLTEPKMTQQLPPKKKRGFALMSPERQREVASKGGRSAHAKGTAHQFTSEEARDAGQKGGKAAAEKRKDDGEDVKDS